MGKYRAPRREQSDQQRDREEVKTLKKLVKHLRKELEKAKNNPFRRMKDEIEEDDPPPEPKKNENKWLCFECKTGHLELVIYETRVGIKYFRRCNYCSHRTKSQTYTDRVEK